MGLADMPVSQPLMMRVCGTSRCMFRMQPHQSSNRSGGLPKESAIAEQLMEYVLRDVQTDYGSLPRLSLGTGSDEETLALLNLLTATIENDRYPLSPRVQTLRGILAKHGSEGK